MQKNENTLHEDGTPSGQNCINIHITVDTSARPLHDPFVLRKMLVAFSAIPAVIAAFLVEDIFLALALYFCLVTCADFSSHAIFRLKPSKGVDPAKLAASEGVTPEEFDAYFDTRRWIRCASLITACVVGCFALLFLPTYFSKVFYSAYVLSTFAGILWVRFFLRIPLPTIVHRSDRHYVPRCGPRPGHISLAQYAAGFFGPIDPHA